MLSIANTERRLVCTVIEALTAGQITQREFEDAIRPLSSEVLQVTAALLCGHAEEDLLPKRSMARAREACRRQAAANRRTC
jgi:hypothetical protein